MNPKRTLGSLFAGLAVACAGKSLTVDDEPASANTESSSSGSSGGSNATGGAGGHRTTGAGGTDATHGAGGSSATNSTGGTTANAGAGGTTATNGAGGSGDPAVLPCDLLEADGHPCVAAHSTVRRLRSAYDGPLYQLCA
ncbi:MAG TPA: arabinofuranosidase catalytic domain-containing protein, partial [Croceibacterium sp.]